MSEKKNITIPADRILGTEVLEHVKDTTNTSRFDNRDSELMTQAYIKKGPLGGQPRGKIRIIVVSEEDDN